jgi:hypothetical protein
LIPGVDITQNDTAGRKHFVAESASKPTRTLLTTALLQQQAAGHAARL